MRLWRSFNLSSATPISTIGCMTSASSLAGPPALKSPAVSAEPDLERTLESKTGITPSTSVRSSFRYLRSSEASSDMISSMVALADGLWRLRMLREERMLLLLALGNDKTDMRSECMVTPPFVGSRQLLTSDSCRLVASDDLSTPELLCCGSVLFDIVELVREGTAVSCWRFVLSVSTDMIVDSRWSPTEGNCRCLGGKTGFEGSAEVSSSCSAGAGASSLGLSEASFRRDDILRSFRVEREDAFLAPRLLSDCCDKLGLPCSRSAASSSCVGCSSASEEACCASVVSLTAGRPSSIGGLLVCLFRRCDCLLRECRSARSALLGFSNPVAEGASADVLRRLGRRASGN